MNAHDSLASRINPLAVRAALPKAPVFDWSSVRGARGVETPSTPASVEEIAHRVVTSSGRAALYQALVRLRLEPGTPVLVPTYHCPSMVAPIVEAGLQPVFFGVRADGKPDLDRVPAGLVPRPRAMIVAHYFGLPISLDATRAWCDARGIVLIEDCAHCLFGTAGDRPVGHWGDYAIASLTKFYPVPEAGLLVSAWHPLAQAGLSRPRWRAQLKGWLDILEVSSRHGRLRGVRGGLRMLFAAKNHLNSEWRQTRSSLGAAAPEKAVIDCDMGRIREMPLFVSGLLIRLLDRQRIFTRRRENFAAYAAALRNIGGARLLRIELPADAAPYVCPLWVDDADLVYDALRQGGMPVFRWDRAWPQTPVLDDDCGHLWRRHVLQLLCHQDLSLCDIATVCRDLMKLLPVTPDALRHLPAEERAVRS